MSQINKSTRSKTPMLLSHVFRHCLWGGNRLIGTYTEGVLGHSEPLAELWLCSTYPGYESRIESGDYKGMTLSELLSNRPEIIGSKASERYTDSYKDNRCQSTLVASGTS